MVAAPIYQRWHDPMLEIRVGSVHMIYFHPDLICFTRNKIGEQIEKNHSPWDVIHIKAMWSDPLLLFTPNLIYIGFT